MRIQRAGDSYYNKRLTDCKLYVRKNLTVVKATEWYYVLVGENSYLPISSLILPEDGAVLLKEAENLKEKVELITSITDCTGGHRNIYLRMERSNQTEEGVPLLLITLFDIKDMETRNMEVEGLLMKYRHFMSINSDFVNEYYFEYTLEDNQFVLYKYVNDRSLPICFGSLEEFVAKMDAEHKPTEEQQEQMKVFCNYLKSGSSAFEMEFPMLYQGKKSSCRVKGGRLYKNKNFIAGIFLPNHMADNEAYYLSPAARDAGTGLFNKRAVTEYTMERLSSSTATHWFMIMDIDDFKNINDTFGHLFGDEVIRKVAEILQLNVGYRGVVGRFGGDEFFVLLEKIPDRLALKNMLKTIMKEMAYAFDPQLKVTASIGITQYPVDGTSYEELFEKADKALYIAKEKGKDRHIIYDEKMHGALQKDDMKTMTMAYAVSRERRREALIDILGNLYEQGVEYVTENPKIQKLIRDMYDLDGVAIYTDYGKTLVCRNGDYSKPAVDLSKYMKDEKWVALYELYDNKDTYVETTIAKLKMYHTEYHQEMQGQELGATIQCLGRKEGEPYALVSFDVFNRNRKWSDTDVEMLSLIGNCISKLLCKN
ncbi:MAG: GGDEF domain-containing protein [Lachnospiraceae bacterium]|nr:GGDEF domain-containing protein [Lachnospiraceae bacterium]